MSFITVNGITYHVEMRGQGVPLVLLHGFAGSAENWHGLMANLQADYRLIAIDILGHGQTDVPTDIERYRMESLACDLAAILNKLDETRVSLLGYSMGGRLALYFAVHYPQFVANLILESSSPGLKTQQERAGRYVKDWHLADNIQARGMAWFVQHWENIGIFKTQKSLSTEKFETQRQQRLANNPLGLANSLLGMGTGVQPSLWKELANLPMPVMLIAGQLDAKFIRTNRAMAYCIPHVEVCFVADAGHNVHLEKPDIFEDSVRSFLDHELSVVLQHDMISKEVQLCVPSSQLCVPSS